MEEDEAFGPIQVAGFGADGVMADAGEPGSLGVAHLLGEWFVWGLGRRVQGGHGGCILDKKGVECFRG